MENAANRLFKIMQKSGTDTISEMINLTVKSISPLELSNGDKIILTSEFISFADFIDTTKIQVGDKFSAISLNGDQMYYINNIIYSAVELNIYEQEIEELKSRVSSLESRMLIAEGEISNLDVRVTNLESRY